MKVKKASKVLLGADLTNEDWNLHLIFGFGEKRLMEFYNNFSKDLHAMCERYELTDREDELWLCTHKLKEKFGIDIHKLNDQFRNS